MAIQLGALRDALIEAGATRETAAKASEELAGYNTEFESLRQDILRVRGDISLLRWMAGTNLVLTLGVLFRVLTH